MKIKKHLIPVLFLIIISIIVHSIWFKSFDIFTYGDWSFGYPETTRDSFALPALWQTANLFGSTELNLSFWPLSLLGKILVKMNFDSPINQRIIFLWPMGLLSVLSMYCLGYYIFRSRIGAWISAIVYGFNTAVLVGRSGMLTSQMAINITPLLFLFFMLALEKKKINYAILAGLTGFVLSFYEFRFFYMVVWILGFYFLYHLIVVERKKDVQTILKTSILSGVVVVLPIILNLYWLLGMYQSQSPAIDRLLVRTLTTPFVDIVRGITFFSYLWTGGYFRAFCIEPIPFRFYLLPVFAFLGFLFYRKKHRVVTFFALLGLLGILLIKMTKEPFPRLYQWLFDYWPGFKVFRESTKFYFYITLAYSILIGAFVTWLWQNWKRKKWQIYTKYILTFLIVFLFLWNTKPLITGEIERLFKPRHIPNDYLILKDFILRQPKYFRILWAPKHSRWSICLNHHPKVNLLTITCHKKWKGLADYDQYGDRVSKKISLPNKKRMINIFKQSFSNNFIDIASIKYVIIPIRDIANDDNFFRYYDPRDAYIKEISKISYLEKVDLDTEELVIFENKDFRPHLYITNEEETIYKNIDYQEIDYQFKNPTEYKIRLKNLFQPIYLNFSENYHPDWKIRVGKFYWFEVLRDKYYFLADGFHFENNAFFNSFLIDPEYIKSHYSSSFYQENPDGSIDLELTLFFRPQAHLYLGLIISLITLASCLGYLGAAAIKKYNRNKSRKAGTKYNGNTK